MRPKRLNLAALVALPVFILAGGGARARAAGWPTYRADASRSGYTDERVAAKLSLHWVHKTAAPTPAWPGDPRVPFDRAYQPVSDGKTVLFGSSADCKVHALDAATGRELWSFFTGAPVRFAPTIWKDPSTGSGQGRAFAVSDDGHLYCLALKDGKLLWKKRGGPRNRMVLGNQRMISKWPARGGPVVVGDVVYFGAGIWPADGIYIYALKAESGETVWVNEESGSIRTGQPHRGGVRGESAVSSQGYLVAAGDKLFVPTGRSVPAAFNRADGKLLYFHLGRYGDANGGATGGTAASVADSMLLTGNGAFDTASGNRVKPMGRVCSRATAAGPRLVFDAYHHWGMFRIAAFDRAKPLVEKEVADRKSKTGAKKKVKQRNNVWKWEQRAKKSSGKSGPVVLAVAGGTVVLGGRGGLIAVDIAGRKTLWKQSVPGTVLGLAVAGGRVFASTESGAIYCFGPGAGRGTVLEEKPAAAPYSSNGVYAAAAEEIIKRTGIKEGYCLDLGCGQGELAYELSKRTELRIYGVEKDPAEVAAARRKLDAAGLYGTRVTVLQGDPAETDLPNYFADLVVSGRSVTGAAVPAKEALRCRCPWRGVLCAGRPAAMKQNVRGPLKGAGSWTHQYADAGNSTCSGDEVVKGPLTMLWFGGPDQAMAERHARPAAPLFAEGRLYVQGLDDVRALNAYNGHLLWKLRFESTSRRYHSRNGLMAGVSVSGPNMCTDGKMLYFHNGAVCLRVDGASGRKLGEIKVPPDENGDTGLWGFIACDGGLLFGSVADGGFDITKRKIYSESRTLFALDAKTGRPKWRYEAKKSIRHNAVAVGGGSVYLIDRPPARADLFPGRPKKGEKRPGHPPGTLVALDAATGKVKWQRNGNIRGTVLALSTRHDVLLVGGQPAGYGVRSESGGKLTAFRASSGQPLHEIPARYGGHPIINDRTIYAASHRRYPGAWDLLTGKGKTGPRMVAQGSCGILAAGKHIITFRAGSLGYVDLRHPDRSRNYGGARPGCWINAIPAGGLVLMPDYSDGCNCSYQIKTNLALETGE
jgi:outer membrane protein assembly factor BamB